ncbi:uncharacterized protein P884DRAFT_256895 [Thermothelomyces heterothallicus CBS 202.75]|uniref:uncharacterized protein n=1 Tax=Thermothelomyces heterothallicus CBS 202.75 TaxID=1149848 RepID=UPI003741F8F7
MASRLIFDPIVLLRVTPLVSSTCTLLYGADQDFFLGLLNRPESRAKSRPLLPAYFGAFFRRGVVFVVACLAVTAWSSVANLYARRPTLIASRSSGWWYVATAALSTAHLLFVPLVAPPIKAIIDADEDSAGADADANATLDAWLRINRVRTLTVDLAAWVASVGAAVGSLAA